MKHKRTQFVIGLLITAFFLFLAFRNVPLRELWASMRSVNYLWAIPFMAITIVSMCFRTLRWKYLLEPVVEVPAPKLFPPIMACFALNSVLPGRAGEFARAYLVAKDYKAPFSGAFATVLVERIADGLGLLVFFVAILWFVPLGAGVEMKWDAVRTLQGASLILWLSIGLAAFAALLAAMAILVLKADRTASAKGIMGLFARIERPRPAAMTLFALAAVALIGVALLISGALIDSGTTYTFGKVYILNRDTLQALSKHLLIICAVLLSGTLLMLWTPFQRFVQSVISAMPILPRGFKKGLNKFIESFATGFHSLRSFRSVFWVIFHTATVWLTVGWSLQIMSYGFPDLKMSFLEGMATSIIICIAILIPAAPGYWGLYEVGTIVALLMLGVVPNTPEGQAQALSYSLVAHAIQMLPIVLLGFFFLGRRHLSLSELAAEAEEEPAPSDPGDDAAKPVRA